MRANRLYNTQKADSLVLVVLGLDMVQCGKIGYCVESNSANEKDVFRTRWGTKNRAVSLYLETVVGKIGFFPYQAVCECLTILR